MIMTYKYFCDNCGRHFASDLPERDSRGCLNDIPCPHCGAWDIYPDTPGGAAASVRDQLDYENRLREWADDEA